MPGCTFQQRWLFTDQFKSWIQESKSINYATCKFCKKDIDLKGMGESALKSHANGKKHQDHAKSNQNKVCDLKNFFKTKGANATDMQSSSAIPTAPTAAPAPTASTATSSKSRDVSDFVYKEDF